MQWLNEERLVQRLVEMIDPSQSPEVLFFSCCIITTAEPEPVMVLICFQKNIPTTHFLPIWHLTSMGNSCCHV